jgi:hypothetical protein
MSLNEQISRIKEVMGLLENQNPIVVYHGSKTKISSFVDDFVGGKNANDQEGPGIYFTTSESNAERYGEYVHKAILRPRKLLYDKPRGGNVPELLKLAKMAPEWEDSALNWNENPNNGIIKAVNDAFKYNNNEKDRFLQIWVDFYRNNPKEYVRNCVKLGYDGIVVDRESLFDGEYSIKHYIVYNTGIIEKVG